MYIYIYIKHIYICIYKAKLKFFSYYIIFLFTSKLSDFQTRLDQGRKSESLEVRRNIM